MPLGHHDGGQRRTQGLWIGTEHFKPPGRNGTTRCLRKTGVAGKDVGQSFFQQHVAGFAESVQQGGGGGVGPEAVLVGFQDFAPGPIRFGQIRSFRRRNRLFAHRIEGQARRQHQPLLRAGHGDVDTPFAVPVVDRGQRGNGVHHQKRGVLCAVDGATHCRDIRGDTGGGLVVHDADRLDLVLLVSVQACGNLRHLDPLTPVASNEFRAQTQALGHLLPQRRKVAGFVHQHLVACAQGVHQRRFPGAGAAGTINHDRTLGLKHLLQI